MAEIIAYRFRKCLRTIIMIILDNGTDFGTQIALLPVFHLLAVQPRIIVFEPVSHRCGSGESPDVLMDEAHSSPSKRLTPWLSSTPASHSSASFSIFLRPSGSNSTFCAWNQAVI